MGGILILGKAHDSLMIGIGFAAVFFGTMNVVGGYVVTDRMLQMFKKKPAAAKADGKS